MARLIWWLLLLVGPVAGAAETAKGKSGARYESLALPDGRVLRECRVLRAEADALIVRHADGVARISFFDLPESLQREHGFDPFAALEHYKGETARQRDAKWRLFWERQQYESEQARMRERDVLQQQAIREWTPVEATILARLGEGLVLARCRRVTFEKTKTKSTLGFTVDGPPRRVLVPFAEKPVVLRFAVPVDPPPAPDSVWQGYVNPVGEGGRVFSLRGMTGSAMEHLAAPAK